MRAARLAAARLAVAAAASADGSRPASPRAPARAEVGMANYYGSRFQGRRTASGERYDASALTCAHRSAPFGTRLRVTNVASGASVVVTVNDRGPFTRGVVVDLSMAAARALGMVRQGRARVRVERIDG